VLGSGLRGERAVPAHVSVCGVTPHWYSTLNTVTQRTTELVKGKRVRFCGCSVGTSATSTL
jgi:hypothetical protein